MKKNSVLLYIQKQCFKRYSLYLIPFYFWNFRCWICSFGGGRMAQYLLHCHHSLGTFLPIQFLYIHVTVVYVHEFVEFAFLPFGI